MKLTLFLLIITLLAASPALSQTRKENPTKSKRPARAEKPSKTTKLTSSSSDEPPPPPPPPPAPKPLGVERLSSDVFRDMEVGKWGVAGLSLPEDLTNESESAAPHRGTNVRWITYSRCWKQTAVYFPSALEVDLTVTTYDADFKAVVPDLRPELATPETLLMVDLMGDERNKNTADSFVKESRRMELDGVKGGFFLADSPSSSPSMGNNRFMAGWYTYRYFEGKAQRISFTVTGRKDELPKALKIIESLRLLVSPSPAESY